MIYPNTKRGAASPTKKTLGQSNNTLTGRRCFRGVQNDCVSKRILNPDAGGAGEDIALSRVAISRKCVIGGVLDEEPAEVGLGAKIAGGHAAFDGGVASAGALKIVIAPVAHIEKIWNSHASWLREEGNQVVGNLDAASLYAAIGKAVRHARQFAAAYLVSFQQL